MIGLNESISDIPVPLRMLRRPISAKGFPVPWFVALIDGVWDFRVIGPDKFEAVAKRRLCWLCGQTLGTYMVFTIGPMCTVNRVSAEPPSHLECARYAARACPFLTKPKMRRNKSDMPDGAVNPAGIMIERNPGVTALWVTKDFKPFRSGPGVLYELGEPERVEWFAQGREATRDEVMASVMSGFPILQAEAEKEGADSLLELARCMKRAETLLPKMEQTA